MEYLTDVIDVYLSRYSKSTCVDLVTTLDYLPHRSRNDGDDAAGG